MSDPASVGARRATSDILIQIVARVLNLALGVVVTAVIVRELGSVQFGQWSTLLVVTTLAGYLTDLGLEGVAVQRAAANPDREPDWLGALLSLRLVIAVPVTLLSGAVAIALAQNHRMLIAGLVISAAILVGTAGTLQVVFQLRVRNDISVAIMTVNSVLWGISVLAIAALGGGMVAFSVAFLAVACVTSALQIGLALRRSSVRLLGSRALWPELIRVGVPVAIGGILINAYARIDQIIVFEAAGAHQAGLYGAVYRVLDQAHFVPISIMTTLFPIISVAFARDRSRVNRLLQQTSDYLAMASLGALAFAIVDARPLVVFLFGNSFASAAPALPILMAAFVLISFGYLVGSMVLILRLQRRFIRYAIAALVFNVALNLALVPPFGFLAAAWITLATEVLVFGLTLRVVLRALEFRPSLLRIARATLAAALLGIALWVVEQIGGGLLADVAVAAICYPALLVALRALRLRELRAILRDKPL